MKQLQGLIDIYVKELVWMKKIKVALNGSDILEKLRNMSKFQEIFEVTEAIMYESPFCNNAVTYEYGVSAEYIIIDLYAASYNLCIKEKDCVTWYSKEQGNWKAGCKILQFNDILKLDWQEKLYMYGENIKQYFPSEKIILVRSKKPEYYVTDCHCRVSANAYREFNCFLETIENFLIEVLIVMLLNYVIDIILFIAVKKKEMDLNMNQNFMRIYLNV